MSDSSFSPCLCRVQTVRRRQFSGKTNTSTSFSLTFKLGTMAGEGSELPSELRAAAEREGCRVTSSTQQSMHWVNGQSNWSKDVTYYKECPGKHPERIFRASEHGSGGAQAQMPQCVLRFGCVSAACAPMFVCPSDSQRDS